MNTQSFHFRLFLPAVCAALLSITAAAQPASPAPNTSDFGGRVGSLPLLKDYRAARASSADRPGNADFLRVIAHQTTDIANLQGPGEITHLWTTIATRDENHLRNIVLRIYYDGNTFPSVESPIGDFYGLGHAKYYYFNNPVQAIGTEHAMNCFWPMPFAKSARVEITNESATPVDAFYYYVDWRKFDALPAGLGYFHAQYRQNFPCENGKRYLILDSAGGPGHYAGVSLSIHTQVGGWWGEGDDVITIDGEKEPSLWGTGSEDYFCGAWCFGETFYRDCFGMPLRLKPNQDADNYWNVYRLHLESPIPFRESIRVEIEHGAGGFDNTRAGRNNDYSSVAYWYAAAPVKLKGILPRAAERIVRFAPPTVPAGVFEPQYMKLTMPRHISAEAQPTQNWAAKSGVPPAAPDGKHWLNEDHLFLRYGKPGDSFAMEFETTAPLKGAFVFGLTKAPDYGRIRIALDGKVVVGDFNGYASRIMPALARVAETATLAPGRHTITVSILGKAKKSQNYFAGIDYLQIQQP
ncbi:MAG: glycoside hydrolase family 172 protein [bacterium]|nr:DUF2961 domain-containing protein [Candidatus Sumerlaeota bacterium]